MSPHPFGELRSGVSYDLTLPVMVLKCGVYPLHAGSLGIIRSIGRLGIPVYGIYEDRFVPAAMSRYLADKFIWRAHRDNVAALLKELCSIGKEIGAQSLLIPTDDFGALLIAENADVLRPYFRFSTPPPNLPRILANKRELFYLCRRLGVPCADSAFLNSREQLDELTARVKFPLVVKIAEPWRLGTGSALSSTSVVWNASDAYRIFDDAHQKGFSELIFQEYIPNDRPADWFFHGYSNSEGRCLVAFTGRKIRSCPPHFGRTAYCQTEVNEQLRQQAEALISAVSFSGIVDLDYRFDARDGTYKILDFNPRVGAQFRVFTDEDDVDVVRALHLDISGRAVPPAGMRRRSLLIEDLDLRVAARYRKADDLTFRKWIGEVRTVTEFGWFSPDDLLPFAAMILRNLAHGFVKLIRKTSRIKTYLSAWRQRITM